MHNYISLMVLQQQQQQQSLLSQASWGRLCSYGFHIYLSCYFLHWFAKPTATLLLYPGLGPAMLRRLEKVFQSTQAELLIFIKNPKNSIHVEQQIKQGQQIRTHEKQIKLQLNGNDNHSYIPQSQKFPNIQDTIRCFIPSNKSIYPLEHFTFLLKMFSAILQQQGLGNKKLHELEGIALSFSSSQEKQPSKQHLFIDIFFFTKIRVIRSSVLSPDQVLSPPLGNKQISAPGNCYLHGQPNQHPFGQFILRRCVICASSVLVP